MRDLFLRTKQTVSVSSLGQQGFGITIDLSYGRLCFTTKSKVVVDEFVSRTNIVIDDSQERQNKEIGYPDLTGESMAKIAIEVLLSVLSEN